MEKTHQNKEKKAHSFSQVQAKLLKKVEPLTRSFFSHLLKLETDIQNKQYTAETLDEVTQLYAKAVEYYDTIKDEITSYFIYKIQDVLATKKSLKLLLDQKSKVDARKNSIRSVPAQDQEDGKDKDIANVAGIEMDVINEVIKENIDEEKSDDEDDPDIKTFTKKRKAFLGKKINRNTKVSFSTMKSQKQKFVHFFHKMEVQKVQQKQNMSTILNDFSGSVKNNDQTVINDLTKQKERLKKLVEERKQRTLVAHTMSASGYYNVGDISFNLKKDNDGNRYANVLEGLEDEEYTQFRPPALLDVGDEGPGSLNSTELRRTPKKTPRSAKAGFKFPKGNARYLISINEPTDFSPVVRTEGDERSNTDGESTTFLTPNDRQKKAIKIPSEELKKQEDSPVIVETTQEDLTQSAEVAQSGEVTQTIEITQPVEVDNN